MGVGVDVVVATWIEFPLICGFSIYRVVVEQNPCGYRSPTVYKFTYVYILLERYASSFFNEGDVSLPLQLNFLIVEGQANP